MTVDEILEICEHILDTTFPLRSGPYRQVVELAQAVQELFASSTCGTIKPELSDSGVLITNETPGVYSNEDARALAAAIFRKVDESEARDKKVQEPPV